MKLSSFLLASGLFAALPMGAFAQNFAGTVISSTDLSTADLYGTNVTAYNDPTAALGQPTTLENDGFDDVSHASMVNSAYGFDATTGKNLLAAFDDAAGQITVQMSAPITHTGTTWYNQDFTVFSNQFFIPTTYGATDGTDMSTYTLADGSTYGSLPQVSVSADGKTFYTVTPSDTVLFPENPYHWNGLSADNPSGWGALNDFSKPVDPNLTAADFAGQTVANADNILYHGSAGGTSYSFFGQTPLTTIDYIRFSANADGSGVIDGISAVGEASPAPEPAQTSVLIVMALGLSGLLWQAKRHSRRAE